MSCQLLVISNDVEFRLRVESQLARLCHLSIQTASQQAPLFTAAFALFLVDIEDDTDSGMAILRRIRTTQKRCCSLLVRLPTASGIEAVLAYDAGADDCFAKDTEMIVIEAKVRSALARTQRCGIQSRRNAGAVDLINGLDFCLTRTEERLLRVLALHPGQVVQVAAIIQTVWRTSRVDPKLLYEHISTLRTKVRSAGWTIANVRGKGYHLVTHADETTREPPSSRSPDSAHCP
ncbi:MAG TPA: winged helix-turn-helix domain-containing protein [Polyangiaceae bacterium]